MCGTHSSEHPEPEKARVSPSDFLANLRQPGPLGWKLRRILANNAIKISRRQRCCGNLGEPGC
jgi:hypothetical protein